MRARDSLLTPSMLRSHYGEEVPGAAAAAAAAASVSSSSSAASSSSGSPTALTKRGGFRKSVFNPTHAAHPLDHTGRVWLEQCYMEKLSRRGTWQKRWFEVSGHHLRYRKAEGAAELLASIDLRHIERVERTGETTFALHGVADRKGYQLRAPSANQTARWVTGLEERMTGVAGVIEGSSSAAPRPSAGTTGAASAVVRSAWMEDAPPLENEYAVSMHNRDEARSDGPLPPFHASFARPVPLPPRSPPNPPPRPPSAAAVPAAVPVEQAPRPQWPAARDASQQRDVAVASFLRRTAPPARGASAARAAVAPLTPAAAAGATASPASRSPVRFAAESKLYIAEHAAALHAAPSQPILKASTKASSTLSESTKLHIASVFAKLGGAAATAAAHHAGASAEAAGVPSVAAKAALSERDAWIAAFARLKEEGEQSRLAWLAALEQTRQVSRMASPTQQHYHHHHQPPPQQQQYDYYAAAGQRQWSPPLPPTPPPPPYSPQYSQGQPPLPPTPPPRLRQSPQRQRQRQQASPRRSPSLSPRPSRSPRPQPQRPAWGSPALRAVQPHEVPLPDILVQQRASPSQRRGLGLGLGAHESSARRGTYHGMYTPNEAAERRREGRTMSTFGGGISADVRRAMVENPMPAARAAASASSSPSSPSRRHEEQAAPRPGLVLRERGQEQVLEEEGARAAEEEERWQQQQQQEPDERGGGSAHDSSSLEDAQRLAAATAEAAAAAEAKSKLTTELASAEHRIARLQLALDAKEYQAAAAETERKNAEAIAAQSTKRLEMLEAEMRRAASTSTAAANVDANSTTHTRSMMARETEAEAVMLDAQEARQQQREVASVAAAMGRVEAAVSTGLDERTHRLSELPTAAAIVRSAPVPVAVAAAIAPAAPASSRREARFVPGGDRRVHVNRHGSIVISRGRAE